MQRQGCLLDARANSGDGEIVGIRYSASVGQCAQQVVDAHSVDGLAKGATLRDTLQNLLVIRKHIIMLDALTTVGEIR